MKPITLALLLAATAATLLLPYGAGLLEAPSPDTAPDATAAVAGCDKEWTSDELLASTLYEQIFEHYRRETGFVDVHVVAAGDQYHLAAIFDLAARDAPLPATMDAELPVQVIGITFHPIAKSPDISLAEETLLPSECTGRISPGARVSTPVGRCTLSFILRDTSGLWYAASAGHCFRGTGDRASVGSFGQIGTVVYNINAGVGNDFALIRIDSEDVRHIDPSMCHWGGPTGIATSLRPGVHHYGFGIVHDATAANRARVGIGFSHGSTSFIFNGAVSSGDSGSGARYNDGTALGTITHVNLGVQGFAAHSAPFAYGTTAARGIALAEAATGLDLRLQTAPVRDLP